jgi:hypothetical protein
MTLLTSVDIMQRPFFFDFRFGKNNQFNFLAVVLQACKRGYLKRGDFLVLDNAAIHSGTDMIPLLRRILETFGMSSLVYVLFCCSFCRCVYGVPTCVQSGTESLRVSVRSI